MLMEEASAIRTSAGMVAMGTSDRGAWHTVYLHSDHAFQNRLPELTQRLRNAVLRVDKEHWGGLLCQHKGDLGVRCIELHEVMEGGQLAAPTHTDEGSCVTIDGETVLKDFIAHIIHPPLVTPENKLTTPTHL